jgi:hypothetical protein
MSIISRSIFQDIEHHNLLNALPIYLPVLRLDLVITPLSQMTSFPIAWGSSVWNGFGPMDKPLQKKVTRAEYPHFRDLVKLSLHLSCRRQRFRFSGLL